MSDHKSEPGISEVLSAFLDGEASPEEMHALLEELERNPGLHATVDHHHQLRARLRGEWHPGLDAGFADRILARLEDPATVTHSKVTAIPVTRTAWASSRNVVGLAMAASFAAIMVLAAQFLLPSDDPVFSADIEHDIALPLTEPRKSIEVAARSPHRDSRSWNDLSPGAAAELNNYLISHNNSAMSHGLGGSMGFMRVAAGDGVAFTGSER